MNNQKLKFQNGNIYNTIKFINYFRANVTKKQSAGLVY